MLSTIAVHVSFCKQKCHMGTVEEGMEAVMSFAASRQHATSGIPRSLIVVRSFATERIG